MEIASNSFDIIVLTETHLDSSINGRYKTQVTGHRSQVTGHCFTNTESIPNTFKS